MKSDQSAQELPGEMKQVKSPPRSPENAPKCSTQRGKSLPKLKVPAVTHCHPLTILGNQTCLFQKFCWIQAMLQLIREGKSDKRLKLS